MVVHIRHDVDVEALRERVFVYDHLNPNWVNHAEHNLFFLRAQQNVFNDILRARGYVFLNDILHQIGFPGTVEGGLVGWALNFVEPVYIEFDLAHRGDPGNSVDIRFNIQDVILFQLPEAHDISVSRFDITHPPQENQ